ncbi:MAG: ATP-binding protein [Opitutales bacterium]
MKRVLLTENDPATSAILRLLLDQDAAELRFLQASDEVLSIARGWSPDLLVLGSRAGECDSTQIVRDLRNDPVLANVPVLMISAADDSDLRLKAFRAGVDEFIRKPFDIAELEARLGTIFRLDRYRALVEQRERFEWVARATPNGILILDAQRRVLYLNPAAQAVVGQLDVGQTRFFAYCLKTLACRPLPCWEAHANGDPPEAADDLLLEDNRGRTWQVQLHPGDDAHLEQSFVTLQDVTEAENSRKLVWNLRDAVAHKLRTPLNGVVANLAILKQLRETLSQEEFEDILDTAVESAERLSNRLTRTSEYFENVQRRPEEGQCTLSTLRMVFELRAAERGVAVSQLELPALDTIVAISHEGIERVLCEALTNAQKFHPEGKPHVELCGELNEAQCVLTVRDDGRHVPEAQLKQLGAAFFQAEEDFTGEVNGCGLGLASVVWRVRMCGGSLRFANRADKPGFELRLTLPVVLQKELEASGTAVAKHVRG